MLTTGGSTLLSTIEQVRLKVSKSTAAKKKSELGQFFTATRIAWFMAGLFDRTMKEKCRLLDAGAGTGSLSSAFLQRMVSEDFELQQIAIDAFEIDEKLHPFLSQLPDNFGQHLDIKLRVWKDDFIEAAVNSITGSLFAEVLPKYTHAILNPPYKKIRSDSPHRAALRQVGIETVNLYSAFVALSLLLLEEHGQLVAIIPRSFCNGPYYRPFREYVLERAALRHIHLFASRNKAFKDDDVLQENIIIMLERGSPQGEVTVTTSTDDSFSDLCTYQHHYDRIVMPDDPERFIHVPTSNECNVIEQSASVCCTLQGIGVNVSTGPVVDFRLKAHLSMMPGSGTVPLLYPCHIQGWSLDWPKQESKKPNALHRNADTEKWLFPNGFYCVVRRFSSKEEKRRVVAGIVRPDNFPGLDGIGFENHLNVFHEEKHGLPEALAYGLTVFLNTTAVDENFRRFNGHTQVNATDLRLIKYPSRATLLQLGEWALSCGNPSQAMIDKQFESLGI